MERKGEIQGVQFMFNSTLPTLMIDNFAVNTRQDDIVLIRLLSSLPEGLSEQGRFMVKKDELKKLLDLTANVLNHYPTKAEKK